jgi:hypothetical protein
VRASSDVLDSRRRVHVELPAAFPQQELNGAKVAFINSEVLFKFGSGVSISVTDHPQVSDSLPREDLKVLAGCLGLFAAFAEALPVQRKHLSLEA